HWKGPTGPKPDTTVHASAEVCVVYPFIREVEADTGIAGYVTVRCHQYGGACHIMCGGPGAGGEGVLVYGLRPRRAQQAAYGHCGHSLPPPRAAQGVVP